MAILPHKVADAFLAGYTQKVAEGEVQDLPGYHEGYVNTPSKVVDTYTGMAPGYFPRASFYQNYPKDADAGWLDWYRYNQIQKAKGWPVDAERIRQLSPQYENFQSMAEDARRLFFYGDDEDKADLEKKFGSWANYNKWYENQLSRMYSPADLEALDYYGTYGHLDAPPPVKAKYDLRHQAPVKQEYIQQLQQALPEMDIKHEPLVNPQSNIKGHFGVAPRNKLMRVPSPGPVGLPTLMHEYTHAVDPSIAATMSRKQDRTTHRNREAELPAMAVERAMEASPYLPLQQRRPFLTGYGKQIDKFGPHISGNFPRDLSSVKNWMQALRRMPGAGIAQRQPFAYNRDRRTPQQRAQGLGNAYRDWMNWQVKNNGNTPTQSR